MHTSQTFDVFEVFFFGPMKLESCCLKKNSSTDITVLFQTTDLYVYIWSCRLSICCCDIFRHTPIKNFFIFVCVLLSDLLISVRKCTRVEFYFSVCARACLCVLCVCPVCVSVAVQRAEQ